MRRFDPERVRHDAPELRRTVHGLEMAYLDSAASSIPPRAVIESMTRYYERMHTNVHRGVYQIAEEATEAYEHARKAVGVFIGAPAPAREVVFTKNATESFNLFAHSWGRSTLRAGDVVVLTEMEHHANLVPWLQLKAELGIELRYLGVTDQFRLDLSTLDEVLDGARLRVDHRHVERPRDDPADPPDRRRRSRRGRPRRDRRRAAGGPRADGRPGPRRRRRVLQRAQDARADRHRRACGPRRRSSTRCPRSSVAAG